jgi:hypothetical protein
MRLACTYHLYQIRLLRTVQDLQSMVVLRKKEKKKDCINNWLHKADTSYNIPLSVGATSSTSIQPSSTSGTCLRAFTRDDGATPCFDKMSVSVEVSLKKNQCTQLIQFLGRLHVVRGRYEASLMREDLRRLDMVKVQRKRKTHVMHPMSQFVYAEGVQANTETMMPPWHVLLSRRKEKKGEVGHDETGRY